MLAVLGAQFLSGQLFRGGQGVSSADLHIWFHAFSFPVTFRHRVDRPPEGDTNCEVISGGHTSVSYTHLDVYKRQGRDWSNHPSGEDARTHAAEPL